MSSSEKCLFNKNHMWCRLAEDGTYVVGISDHAQNSLGEITYVELPDCGVNITQDTALGLVESIKVVNELVSPVSGTVIEVNTALSDEPVKVNDSPYENGWMLRVKIDSPEQLDNLMSDEQYAAFLG